MALHSPRGHIRIRPAGLAARPSPRRLTQHLPAVLQAILGVTPSDGRDGHS